MGVGVPSPWSEVGAHVAAPRPASGCWQQSKVGFRTKWASEQGVWNLGRIPSRPRADPSLGSESGADAEVSLWGGILSRRSFEWE